MDWYEPEVQALERVAAHPPGAAVFYGSSTIRMWDSLEQDFAGCPVINRGFGGATLAACVVFFERLVLPPKPASLVLYAGDNDIGDGVAPETVIASFLQLQEKVRQNLDGAAFTFISIKPSPARWHLADRIRAVNNRVRQERVNFVDLYPYMLDSRGNPNPEFFLEDGLHMSAAGYKLWTAVLWEHQNTIFTGCSSPLIPPSRG